MHAKDSNPEVFKESVSSNAAEREVGIRRVVKILLTMCLHIGQSLFRQ